MIRLFHRFTKLSIGAYLSIILILATVPAVISALYSLKQADATLASASHHSSRLGRIEFDHELRSKIRQIVALANRIATWNDTKALFNDATYYSYWKQSRIDELLGDQFKSHMEIGLFGIQGKPLSPDNTLNPGINPRQATKPAIVVLHNHAYLIYFHPITISRSKNNIKTLGYLGMKVDIHKVLTDQFRQSSSRIKKIHWNVGNREIADIDTVLKHVTIDIKQSNELESLVKIIKQGYMQYFIYTILLLITIAILLLLFIARPLSKLTNFLLHSKDHGNDIIPDDLYGPIKVKEFEKVREALNEYKNRFLYAASNLEKTNKELLHLTFNDPLTNCANRRGFERRLKYLLSSPSVSGQEHALCYIDVDQFKVVNDTCGHIAGDELLRQIAALLENKIRETDLLARLGGDEFGIILSNCDAEYALALAENIRLTIKGNRFIWQKQSLDISVSIGLVPFGKDNATMSEILKNADAACYTAKDSGRNRVHRYEPNDEEVANRHGEMQWLNKITTALDLNQFTLFGQRIHSLNKTNSPLHFEVLLRYLDSDGETVLPMAFIPAAEQYGVIKSIDKWVINRSMRLLGEALDKNENLEVHLSINLSGHSIGDQEILDWIKSQIRQYQIPPEWICFEITETAAIANLSQAVDFIKQLRFLGCKFALDDFGSGLSSFGYLTNLDVDSIKIDGHFIKSIKDNRLSRIIINAINQIGKVLDLQVIAEFAEDKVIIEELKKLNIHFAQGIGIHRPEPLENLLNPIMVQNLLVD